MNYKLLLVISLAVAFAYCTFTQRRYSTPFASNYESQSAKAKLDFIWAQSKSDNGFGGTFMKVTELLALVKPQFLGGIDFSPVGHNISDQNAPERRKLIHSVGMTAKIAFNFESNLPFTGQFSEKKSIGLIRASSATDPTAYDNAPGISIKLFRDGVTSANLVAMWSLFGQSHESNFFKHPLSNHVSALPSINFSTKFLTLTLLNKRFSKMDSVTNVVGLSDFVKNMNDGTSISEPKAPFALVFQPASGVQKLCENDKIVNGGYGCFDKIKSGTLLYTVWYVDTMVNKTSVNSTTLKKFGTIVTESEFIRSKFMDESVQFRHVFWADEVKALNKPEWGGENMSNDFKKNDGAEKWEGKFPA